MESESDASILVEDSWETQMISVSYNLPVALRIASFLRQQPNEELTRQLIKESRIDLTVTANKFTNRLIGTDSSRKHGNKNTTCAQWIRSLSYMEPDHDTDEICPECHQFVPASPSKPPTKKKKGSNGLATAETVHMCKYRCDLEELSDGEELVARMKQCCDREVHYHDLEKRSSTVFDKLVKNPYNAAISEIELRATNWWPFFEAYCKKTKEEAAENPKPLPSAKGRPPAPNAEAVGNFAAIRKGESMVISPGSVTPSTPSSFDSYSQKRMGFHSAMAPWSRSAALTFSGCISEAASFISNVQEIHRLANEERLDPLIASLPTIEAAIREWQQIKTIVEASIASWKKPTAPIASVEDTIVEELAQLFPSTIAQETLRAAARLVQTHDMLVLMCSDPKYWESVMNESVSTKAKLELQFTISRLFPSSS